MFRLAVCLVAIAGPVIAGPPAPAAAQPAVETAGSPTTAPAPPAAAPARAPVVRPTPVAVPLPVAVPPVDVDLVSPAGANVVRHYPPERCEDTPGDGPSARLEGPSGVLPEALPETSGETPGGARPGAPGSPVLAPPEPPITWTEWTVGGPLPAGKRSTLQTLLAPQMTRHRNLGARDRCELQEFVREKLGYYLAGIAVESLPDTGKRAVLEIEPVTRVRRVTVKVTDQPWWDLIPLDRLFDEEITRRMRLRAGSMLASEPVTCRSLLRLDEERISQYLRSKGYFEAKVRIGADLDCDAALTDDASRQCPAMRTDDNATTLEVCIRKGPRYDIDIDRIQVEGNVAIPTDEIRAKFRHGQLCIGSFCLLERFSQQNLNQDVQEVEALYQKRGYPAARVRTDFDPGSAASFDRDDRTVQFTVTVNERRRISVVFEGHEATGFSAETLESLLTFDEEGSYDDVEVTASADAIRRYYQSRGYFEATVTAERVDLSIYERVVFTIEPGPRLRVDTVAFQGNRALGTDQLRAAIGTRSYDTSPLFGSSGYLTSEDLARDVASIVRLYEQRGYRGVRVSAQVSRSTRAANSAADSGLDSAAVLAALVAGNAARDRSLHVRFDIDEGEQTVVRRVDFAFEGAHTRSAADLGNLVGIQPGEPYIAQRVDDGRERIGRHYFENAYPRASVSRQVCPSPEGSGVDVLYRVAENQPARFGKVLVHGNFKTADWVILGELGYREGVPFTLGRAEAGSQNLRASGLFNAVLVRFIGLDESAGQDVHAVVEVQERHGYALGTEVAAGYSSDRELFMEAALYNHNILGQGLRLDFRGQYGQQILAAESKLVVPQWFVRKLTEVASGGRLSVSSRFEASAFWRRDETERFGELTSLGTSAVVSKLGRRGFFQGWLLSMRYDFRQRNLDEELVRGSGSSGDLDEVPVSVRTGAVGPQLVIDKRKDRSGRPNPLTPESGFKLELRAQYASRLLGGQDEFLKLGTSVQHFWKPSTRLLVTQGARYDHAIPLSAAVLPEVERYFAGGDTTVRGFEEDRLATEIIEQPLPPLGQITRIRVLPAGGNVRFIHNLDVQMNVWKLLDVPVASAVFLDTGLVTNSLDRFELTEMRHSLGVALFRWVAPFGSLSIEYALPLDPRPGDNLRGRFHINFGLLF